MSRNPSHFTAVLLAVTALAGLLTLVLAPQAARAATRSVTAVDGLELRAAPKAGAQVVRCLPILTEVIILGKAKQPATIGGRRDSWVYVQANYCPDSADKSLLCETVYQKGWVADSQLAYGERFKPLSDWRAGRIEAANGNTSWRYAIAADGAYTYDWESWTYDTKSFPCPAERKRGRHCVESRAESGQLYRYGDVVRPGSSEDLLYIDADGALCDRMSTPGARRCDR